MSLKKKIVIMMVCIVFSVSLFLGLVIFQQAEGIVKKFEKEIVELNAKNSVVLLRDTFDNVRNVLVQMIDSTNLYELTVEIPETEQEFIQRTHDLTGRIREFLSDSSLYGETSLSFVNVYLKNGINAHTADDGALPFSDFESVCDYLEQEQILARDEYKALVWLDTVRTRGVNAVDTECFVCVRFLYDRVTMQRIGAIVAGINIDDISILFKNVFPGALIINEMGNIVIGKIASDENGDILNALTTALTNERKDSNHIAYSINGVQKQALYWKTANNCAYFVIPLSDGQLFKSEVALSFLEKLVITIVIAILVAGIVSLFTAKMLTNGLVKLTKVVQRIAGGDRDERFLPKKHDEVAYLGLQFNQMLDELQNHYEKLQCYQEEKQQLELSLLQSKINPHLLYNTLDIAVWAIKNKDARKAEELIYSLSRFFKQTLAKGREFISLEDEIRLITSYIELQCLAGDKAYKLRTEIEPCLLDYYIPHLLLQPIVENAVLHGFRDFIDDGQILVSASVAENGNIIEIRVRDNGIGMSPAQVKEINGILQDELYREHDRSYGLKNIARRVKNHYGDQFGLTVDSEVGEFTEALIRLPFADGTKQGE